MELKLSVPSNRVLQRIAEPVLLGISVNIIVNLVMNHGRSELLTEEFLTAVFLSVPITELNRYINYRLERKISWTTQPLQRLATHFGLIFICLLILLNGPGIAYMWIAQKGFFSVGETIVINLVTLAAAILLTFVQWAVYFYRQWVNAERQASVAEEIIDNLKQQLIQPTLQIAVQKGTAKINIEVQSIRFSGLAFGTVRVYADSGLCGTFPGSVTQLYALLPKHLFFQVSRDAIVHKQVIAGIAPGGFGKIVLTLDENYKNGERLTVSRPKAAAFRKWYNSNSA